MTSRTGRTNRMGDNSRNQSDSNVGAGAGAGAVSGSVLVARNESAGVSYEEDISSVTHAANPNIYTTIPTTSSTARPTPSLSTPIPTISIPASSAVVATPLRAGPLSHIDMPARLRDELASNMGVGRQELGSHSGVSEPTLGANSSGQGYNSTSTIPVPIGVSQLHPFNGNSPTITQNISVKMLTRLGKMEFNDWSKHVSNEMGGAWVNNINSDTRNAIDIKWQTRLLERSFVDPHDNQLPRSWTDIPFANFKQLMLTLVCPELNLDEGTSKINFEEQVNSLPFENLHRRVGREIFQEKLRALLKHQHPGCMERELSPPSADVLQGRTAFIDLILKALQRYGTKGSERAPKEHAELEVSKTAALNIHRYMGMSEYRQKYYSNPALANYTEFYKFMLLTQGVINALDASVIIAKSMGSDFDQDTIPVRKRKPETEQSQKAFKKPKASSHGSSVQGTSTSSTTLVNCFRCGRSNHTAEQCKFISHEDANTNPSVKWIDTAVAKTKYAGLTVLSPKALSTSKTDTKKRNSKLKVRIF